MSNTRREYCLGIDEAGRGPVLGPMVYGTAWCPIDQKDEVKNMGFMDSKVLNAEIREKLFEDVKNSEFIGWAVDILTAEDISGKMLRRHKCNLNTMSHNSAIGLIQLALDKGVNLQEVFVDTVGNQDWYQEKLKGLFPGIRTIVVCKKADSIYPIVSAASICAKVTRDLETQNFVFREPGIQVSRVLGSGYPGDAITKKWVEDHIEPLFGWPSIVRFSWGTAKKLLKKQGTPMEWDDDDEAEEDDGTGDGDAAMSARKKSQKLTQFFASSDMNSSTNQQHRIPIASRAPYFAQRHMNLTTSF